MASATELRQINGRDVYGAVEHNKRHHRKGQKVVIKTANGKCFKGTISQIEFNKLYLRVEGELGAKEILFRDIAKIT